MSQPLVYIYFDTAYVPYYVGEGSRHRFTEKHGHIPVPPKERRLNFPQDCREAALAFESYLIKRIGRRPDCCGNREDEKIGPLINRTDGGLGLTNPRESAREVMRKAGSYVGRFFSGGCISGRQNVSSGHMDRIRTPESRAKGGRSATHIKWHINRGIVKADCFLCSNS
jgi:hypothetical protein